MNYTSTKASEQLRPTCVVIDLLYETAKAEVFKHDLMYIDSS